LKNPNALKVLVWSWGRLVTLQILERKKNYASSKKLLASI